ncbi:hypothetical protein KO493_03270 [Tamlana agarivorans]|uniref:Uncharacterized protein n=1 Tax=Pseudotamlana agarivorans TaxID=481183 RepID=A0ACC5U639_9FLAO|nr:hypothetical protein [Tamlana agarivorans]MBU2949714.1 hypothetical protein [Tamlana agarivorans]
MKREDYIGYGTIGLVLIILAILVPLMSSDEFWIALISQLSGIAVVALAVYLLNKL